MVATERIEAVRMSVNGTSTAVLGVDPSVFREFAARPTGASNALWQGVASGGIAVSYTMGTLDKISLGGTRHRGRADHEKLRVVAFGTLGIGGVNAVVSDATARALGAPADNAIVVSVRAGRLHRRRGRRGTADPQGGGRRATRLADQHRDCEHRAGGRRAAGAGQADERRYRRPRSTPC